VKPFDLPFFVTPATQRVFSEAPAVAVLIGSYDGSGNFGDIAQFDAALRLLEPLTPGLLVLPVLERDYRRSHLALPAAFGKPPEHALFFDPEHRGQDDLVPLVVPPTVAVGSVYLYGGGYLNPSWGGRKLDMLRAAEDLLQTAGVEPVRLASGLQVDPTWIKALSVEDAALLGSFEMLGARDPLSARALADFNPAATVLETGDDALGAIPTVPMTDVVSAPPTKVRVNLHFAEHDWVSGRPGGLRDLILDFATELGRRAGRPVIVRPLIAYVDDRIDERPGVAALAADARGRGIEVEESLILRPAELEAIMVEMQQAVATISCSYHVAMASLLLGIPTVVFADNPYYEQKAAGLASAFGLPSSFALTANSDPTPVVDAIHGDGGSLREEIVRGGVALRRERTRAEMTLLAHLAGGLLAKLGTEVAHLGERLQLRSAEPAELQVALAASRTEAEELRRPAVEAAVLAIERKAERAEERVQQAEERAVQAEAEAATVHARLADLLGSRSWKLGAPVRWMGRMLRRLKRDR
jgi:hypothetical protein